MSILKNETTKTPNWKLSLTLAGAVVLLTSSLAIAKNSSETDIKDLRIKPTQKAIVKPQVSIKTIHFKEAQKFFDVDFQYPQLMCKDAERVRKANWLIKNMAVSAYKRLKDDMPKTAEDAQGLPRCYVRGGYSVTFPSSDLVCVRLDMSEQSGGVHPNHGVSTVVCDLTQAKALKLEDIFGQDVDFETISDLCRRELYRTIESPVGAIDENGLLAEEGNFAAFTVGSKGIEFIFQPYQVAPYALGMPTATLPFSEIKPLLIEGTAVERLARNVADDSNADAQDAEWVENQVLTAVVGACMKQLKTDPNNFEIYEKLGEAYFNADRFEAASIAYSKALSLGSRGQTPLLFRGISYLSLGNSEKAIADFDKVLAMDKSDSVAYCNRGIAYSDIGLHENAIEDFSKSIALNGQDAYSFMHRGIEYCTLGVYDKAVNDLTKAIELDPSESEAYEHRAIAYKQLGMAELAKQDKEKVNELERL